MLKLQTQFLSSSPPKKVLIIHFLELLKLLILSNKKLFFFFQIFFRANEFMVILSRKYLPHKLKFETHVASFLLISDNHVIPSYQLSIITQTCIIIFHTNCIVVTRQTVTMWSVVLIYYKLAFLVVLVA